MITLLTANFRDYKRFWFKTLVTLVGLVTSLSLFIVIDLFTILFTINQEATQQNTYFTHQLVNKHGFISHSDINSLITHPSIKNISVKNEQLDSMLIQDESEPVIVKGLDVFNIPITLISDENLNIKNAYLIGPDYDKSFNGQYKLANAKDPININFIKTDLLNSSELVMDISLYQYLYTPHDHSEIIYVDLKKNSQLELSTYLTDHFPNLVLSKINEEKRSKNMVSSLEYNLRFLALLSLLVSTCLCIQFFRFLGKQRYLQDKLLYELGISKRELTKLFIIEITIIGVIAGLLSLILGYILATKSLVYFNQLITTFYFYFSASQIYIHPILITKLLIVIGLSLYFGYLSYKRNIIQKERNIFNTGIVLILLISACLITVILYPNKLLGFVLTLIFLLLMFKFSIWTIALASKFNHIQQQSLFLKMSTESINQDRFSHSIIVYVISLSLGLILSMGLFINSFEFSLLKWLDTVVYHDVYIQHKLNSIKNPISIPESDTKKFKTLNDNYSLHTISRLNLFWNNQPIQLRVIDSLNSTPFFYKVTPKSNLGTFDVLISESFSQKHGLKQSDELNLAGASSEKLNVAGIIYDYTSEFGQVIANRHILDINLPYHGLALKVRNNPNISEDLKKLNLSNELNIMLQTNLIKQTKQIFNETFSFTWFIVILTGFIALFSLVNILTIICINRKQELVQLYFIGFNKAKLTLVILAHMVTLLISGIINAVIMGVGLYILIVYAIQYPTFSWSIFLNVPFTFITIILLSFLIIGVIITAIFMSFITRNLVKGGENEIILLDS